MRETARYETFLRPILERLKQIDGRAPISIMVNGLTPTNAQLQAWLKEGLSLEVHTLAHPCPLLAKGSFQAAADTYHGCVELLNLVPGNKAVAFRMPCCDSMNSPSPRFYAEMFNRVSPGGQFLTIDSSVMNFPSPKFRKYLASETNAITRVSMKSFVTTIDDYPYPYVIGRLCWEFPAMVPSDWEANNLHGPTNGITVNDWKWALDDTVKKQGTFTFIFHPHGWITSRQMIEFIDHAVKTHGPKVKFLTFREAQQRLDKHLLAGQPLRDGKGGDNGVRLLDLNDDGFVDVVGRKTRLWDPKARAWNESDTPSEVSDARFGILNSAYPIMLAGGRGWKFDGRRWTEEAALAKGLKGEGIFRDADNDDYCEFISDTGIFAWSAETKSWKETAYSLPKGTTLRGGLRFVDLNADGFDDILFSNDERFSLHQFVSKANPRLMWKVGWNDEVVTGSRNDPRAIPPIVRAGKNNGVWFGSGHMWIQNEDTAHLPDKVDRRSYKQLLSLDDPAPRSPQESLKAIKVRRGFKVELVASEPLVTDPIAFDWGADGKLWVVEMSDYPLGINGKPGGQVKYLEDVDGDGIYDRAHVLLDGLKYPSGIIAWRDGVIVASAPDILYADAKGRKVLFTGFTEGNPQHLVNGFDYGLDNWIYGANGDSGGKIKGVNLSGHDIRFRPDDGAFEAIEGQTQYGRHRDDWGNWFGNNNPTWLWHYVLPERYLARNPQLPIKTTKQITTDKTKAFPLSRIRQRFNDFHQAGHVTSGNSATPYRDELFGPEFAMSVFISEPVHNLVHREVLEEDGVSFHSHRADDEQQSEFLASEDNWFRPTMMRTGPDGALYIADMYRLVLEHPEWITKDIQARLDLRAGDNMGRIYRVYPEGATLRKIPRLDKLDTSGLVQAMDSPNGWQRDTAQRLLVQRKDPKAKPLLAELVRKSSRPKARLQALCTLDGFGRIAPELLQAAFKDASAAVREQAARLAEPAQALELAGDESLWVLLQVAFRLGDSGDPAAGEALLRIADKTSDNVHLQMAVLSSVPPHVDALVKAIINSASPPDFLVEHVAKLAALKKHPELARLASHTSLPTRLAALAGVTDAGKKLNESDLNWARGLAVSGSEAERLSAARLLGRNPDDADVLVKLLYPQNSAAVQKAAVAALRRGPLSGLGEILVQHWKHFGPGIRNEVLTLLLSRAEYGTALIDAVEVGTISRNEIGTAYQQKAQQLGERARKAFGAPRSNRAAVLKEYESVPRLKGDPVKGAALFQQHCATCHRLKGQGTDLAPDLGMVSGKSVEALLVAILDPNQAMEDRYVAYTATTKDGREISGIISTETANSITMRSAGGVEETILRADLRDVSSSALSLMPEGLEAALPPQAMADLIAHILGS
ncbi:MAG TPA: PVC-type heme-binding CxxCH protein [Verrucomicrobiae bacterium]|nr:PVC-type heme-binding CxxCH protein [Verrucomicrobiae bacterium]